MTRNRVEEFLLQAREYLDLNRREDALECIKKALSADPGEMVITEVILNMERSKPVKTEERETTVQATIERNNADNMDPKLEKAFRLSDEALAAGNDAKALAYLKKAAQLFPDQPEVEEKLNLLKTSIRAGNLVKIGLAKLEEGDVRKAVAASRKAFQLMPEVEGLQELISGIEDAESSVREEKPDTVPDRSAKQQETNIPDSGAMLWADRIRAAVKEEKFEEAGKMVAEAVKNHPGDPLLESFHIKLKRLGFVD